ncbi:HNH endonuclease [Deinococcus radiomollis]
MDDHHITPKHAGGKNELDNRLLLHRWCHHSNHQRVGYKWLKA